MTISWVFSQNHQVFFLLDSFFHNVYGKHTFLLSIRLVKGIYIGSMYAVQIFVNDIFIFFSS